MKYEAILALHNQTNPNTGLLINGKVEELTGLEKVKSNGAKPKFTWEQVLQKEKELEDLEPMRILRLKRNRKLAETDWRASSDLTLGEWSTYRQALRDLPSTAKPTLDDNGNLQNVTWPNEPT